MYFPMGGSRVSWPRHYFNLMMVFVVSGWWHAGLGYGISWAFLLWGAINGFYQWVGAATEKWWRRLGERLPRTRNNGFLNAIRIVYTFHLITFAWIFFRASSIEDAVTIIRRIFDSLNLLPTLVRTYLRAAETDFFISIGLIVLLMLVEWVDERKSIWERLRPKPVVVRWAVYYVLIFGLIILGKWGLSQFIYMPLGSLTFLSKNEICSGAF
ncbi:MAG: MBOAT family protein, partial [Candidatus Bipolaricaulia bacterium]